MYLAVLYWGLQPEIRRHTCNDQSSTELNSAHHMAFSIVWQRLGCNVGHQEASRCCTKGGSEESITCRGQRMQLCFQKSKLLRMVWNIFRFWNFWNLVTFWKLDFFLWSRVHIVYDRAILYSRSTSWRWQFLSKNLETFQQNLYQNFFYILADLDSASKIGSWILPPPPHPPP